MSEVHDLLVKTKSLCDEKHWSDRYGIMSVSRQNYCVLGALNLAAGRRDQVIYPLAAVQDGNLSADEPIVKAAEVLRGCAVEMGGWGWDASGDAPIYNVNDVLGFEGVHQMLDCAINKTKESDQS